MAAIRGQPKPWKIETVEYLKKILTEYPSIAIVGFRGVPANQMQEIRRKYRDKFLLKVIKNTLLEKAIDSLNGDYEKLKEFIKDQTAIVASNLNPFKLYKLLEETKVPAPLKPGQVSPVDVVVEKGPTNIPPGPMMGDLQAAGIPTAIERGKVVIKETVTLVKAGEVVRPEVARALERLNIKPVKVGLDTRAIFEKGVIFTPDILAVDTEKIFNDFVECHRKALNFAVNINYVTTQTAELILAKAYLNAKALAIELALPERDVMPEVLARAYAQALSLASVLPSEALDEELINLLSGLSRKTEVKKEEEKVVKEEKKEEEKKEEEEKEEEVLEGLGALFG